MRFAIKNQKEQNSVTKEILHQVFFITEPVPHHIIKA